jgi:3-dehydroquinate synthase
MITVPVQVAPRPYHVHIENGLLAKAGEVLRPLLAGKNRLFVITVDPVRRRWAKRLTPSLTQAGFSVQLLSMPEGERFKRLSTAEALSESLSRLGADRDSVILAFGGGIAGDVAGFVASLYMRGIDFVQVPTTVLAQVDASIGGKTGVNLKAGKNLVGAFHQPRAVLIDPAVLASLPDREYRAGLYESLKAGIIGNADLFAEFENSREAILKRDPATVERIIAASVRLKAEVVSSDERENGLRRVLNLGHTIGHALEAETNYRSLLHGEAVAWGMIGVARIASDLGRLSPAAAERIASATRSLGPLPRLKLRSRKILARLQADKKTRGGKVHFILPIDIGKVEIANDVPEAAVLRAVDAICELSAQGSRNRLPHD